MLEMIVFGLGSGRTGTASLSHLIGSQQGAICFHELNPTGVVFDGNPQPLLNTVHEFQAILEGGDKRLLALDYSRPASVAKYSELLAAGKVSILGDIAFYYLRYVDDILAVNRNVRFVCIKRDRDETVESWLKKSALKRWTSLWIADRFKSLVTRTPFHTSKNFWQVHNGETWQLDPVWDKTFPKFEAASKKQAIEKYWDYYYEEAERYQLQYPDYFRIFPIETMSSRDGQREILRFIGLIDDKMVLKEEFHAHKSAPRRS
jgi:hypothetical protein